MSLTEKTHQSSIRMTKTDTYAGVHQWILRHYGNAAKCENPGCVFSHPKRYEWALRKGFEYARNITHFLQLCPSCHRKYDYTEAHKAKLSRAKSGKPSNHQRSVSQYSLNGIFINSFKCVSVAAKTTNTNRSSISYCVSGKYKTANGFLWKRV